MRYLLGIAVLPACQLCQAQVTWPQWNPPLGPSRPNSGEFGDQGKKVSKTLMWVGEKESLMRTIFSLMLVVASVITAGCGGNPSENEAREVVAGAVREYGALDYFSKVNGEKLEIAGQSLYRFHFNAATKLGPGWAWRKKDMVHSAGLQRANEPTFLFKPQLQSLAAETIYVARGTIDFRKTEKGWVKNNVEVSQYGICPPPESSEGCIKKQWGSKQ